jgi:hypothetical protein
VVRDSVLLVTTLGLRAWVVTFGMVVCLRAVVIAFGLLLMKFMFPFKKKKTIMIIKPKLLRQTHSTPTKKLKLINFCKNRVQSNGSLKNLEEKQIKPNIHISETNPYRIYMNRSSKIHPITPQNQSRKFPKIKPIIF